MIFYTQFKKIGVKHFFPELIIGRDSIQFQNEEDQLYQYWDEQEFEALETDPWSQNNTESWAGLLESLGIDVDNEDVALKQRSAARKHGGKQKRTNLNRFREHHVSSLHQDFVRQYKIRMNNLHFFNEMSGVSYGRKEEVEAEAPEEVSGKSQPQWSKLEIAKNVDFLSESGFFGQF